jgi:hypothetical protein
MRSYLAVFQLFCFIFATVTEDTQRHYEYIPLRPTIYPAVRVVCKSFDAVSGCDSNPHSQSLLFNYMVKIFSVITVIFLLPQNPLSFTNPIPIKVILC